MKNFLLGAVIVASLAFVVWLSAAPLRSASVTNPMTANLDGGGYGISNVQAIYAANVFSAGEIVAGQPGYNGVIQLSTPSVGNGPGVIAGDDDPSLVEQTAMPRGSMYLRSNGEWWRKSGTGPFDWTKVAG